MAVLLPVLKKEIKQKALDAGYKQRGYWYYKKSEYEDFQSLISFGYYSYSDGRGVSAFVGVHNVLVEQLYNSIMNVKLNNPFWLLSVNVGYLQSLRFKEWHFTDISKIGIICGEIFEDIRKYGKPFYDKYEHLDKLIEAYEKRRYEVYGGKIIGIDREQQFYTLPLLYLAVNQKGKGIDFMDSLQRENGFHLNDDLTKFYTNYCKLIR